MSAVIYRDDLRAHVRVQLGRLASVVPTNKKAGSDMEVIGFILIIGWFVFCGWAGVKLVQLKKKHEATMRERYIEQEMRQEIIDRATEKKIAEKILREQGGVK